MELSSNCPAVEFKEISGGCRCFTGNVFSEMSEGFQGVQGRIRESSRGITGLYMLSGQLLGDFSGFWGLERFKEFHRLSGELQRGFREF